MHGVVAGMLLGMMPMMHHRMGPGKDLPDPGILGKNLGSMVPVGVIMLHVTFRAVVGIPY